MGIMDFSDLRPARSHFTLTLPLPSSHGGACPPVCRVGRGRHPGRRVFLGEELAPKPHCAIAITENLSVPNSTFTRLSIYR